MIRRWKTTCVSILMAMLRYITRGFVPFSHPSAVAIDGRIHVATVAHALMQWLCAVANGTCLRMRGLRLSCALGVRNGYVRRGGAEDGRPIPGR